MRYVLTALALWFGLEMVFVAILTGVSAMEGHRAKREAAVSRVQFLGGSNPGARPVGEQHHHRASA